MKTESNQHRAESWSISELHMLRVFDLFGRIGRFGIWLVATLGLLLFSMVGLMVLLK